MNRTAAGEVLARHGIDPAADETVLTTALQAHGWQLSVEEVPTSRGTRGRRYRAVVRHTPPPDRDPARWFPVHLQHTGRTVAEALTLVLATVLEREATPVGNPNE